MEKDFANGDVTVYDEWGGEKGVYSEPLHEQEWTITGDSVKMVLGYIHYQQCRLLRNPTLH